MERWYVTRVKTGQERRAIINLEIQGFTVFCPKLRLKTLRSKSFKEKALFPGYVFIKVVEHKGVASVRSTYGVADIVRFGQTLATVPGSLIEDFVEAEKSLRTVSEFNHGSALRIYRGPFSGLNAIYDEPDGELRSIVLMNLLGSQQRISIENVAIEAA